MVLFFYFPTNIPQVYHTCFTKDCLTLTIWSQYKGSGTWSDQIPLLPKCCAK